MTKLLENAGSKATVISVSDGLELIPAAEEAGHAGENDPGSSDPHVWWDPNNVQHWVNRIEQALSDADPAHAATYQANAKDYRQALSDLDTWISQQVAQVPQANRKIVSDHRRLWILRQTLWVRAGWSGHPLGQHDGCAVCPGAGRSGGCHKKFRRQSDLSWSRRSTRPSHNALPATQTRSLCHSTRTRSAQPADRLPHIWTSCAPTSLPSPRRSNKGNNRWLS